MKRYLPIVGLALGIICCASGRAPAEVFILHNGGQVRGELVNREQSPRKQYVVNTAGGKVTLDAEQVKEVKKQSAAELKYDQISSGYADTVEGQWELAEWCRENHLSQLRKKHLERIIELDPNHLGARRGLGYSHVQGRWVTQDQLFQENGYVRYKGKWVLPQEMDIKEQERKESSAQLTWSRNLKKWNGWLTTDKAAQAEANIKAIDDPVAVHALAKCLNDPKQSVPRSGRLLYVQALGRLETPAGMDALIAASLWDADEEIRLASLDEIVAHKYKPAVAKYVQALKNKENAIVNRAALGLGQMKDPAAIGPLIDALLTTHTFEVQQGPPGQISSGFTTGPKGAPAGGSFNFGGGGPQIVKQQFENRDVLQALVDLSGGVSYNFDRNAWKYWFAARKKSQSLDARRDNTAN